MKERGLRDIQIKKVGTLSPSARLVIAPAGGFVREPIFCPGSIELCTVNLKHLENSCIALCQSQGFQKGIICRCFNDKILQNHNFWTFWIILFILIDLKHVENNFIELLWSQGFQKGIICRGLNEKSENQQKAVGTKH